MSKIVNKFFLNRGKAMLESNLGQPKFTYSACGLITNHSGKPQRNR